MVIGSQPKLGFRQKNGEQEGSVAISIREPLSELLKAQN